MTLIRVEGICLVLFTISSKIGTGPPPWTLRDATKDLIGSSYPTGGRRHSPIRTMICARSQRIHNRVSHPPFPCQSSSHLAASSQPVKRALLTQVVRHPCCSSRRCLIVELSYVPSGPVCVSHNPSGFSSFLRDQVLRGFPVSSHRVDRNSLFLQSSERSQEL